MINVGLYNIYVPIQYIGIVKNTGPTAFIIFLHSIYISHVSLSEYFFVVDDIRTKTYVFLLSLSVICFVCAFVLRHHMHSSCVVLKSLQEKWDWLKTKYLTITCGIKSFCLYTFFRYLFENDADYTLFLAIRGKFACVTHMSFVTCMTCLNVWYLCNLTNFTEVHFFVCMFLSLFLLVFDQGVNLCNMSDICVLNRRG